MGWYTMMVNVIDWSPEVSMGLKVRVVSPRPVMMGFAP